jgi:hypothetical protein
MLPKQCQQGLIEFAKPSSSQLIELLEDSQDVVLDSAPTSAKEFGGEALMPFLQGTCSSSNMQ